MFTHIPPFLVDMASLLPVVAVVVQLLKDCLSSSGFCC